MCVWTEKLYAPDPSHGTGDVLIAEGEKDNTDTEEGITDVNDDILHIEQQKKM